MELMISTRELSGGRNRAFCLIPPRIYCIDNNVYHISQPYSSPRTRTHATSVQPPSKGKKKGETSNPSRLQPEMHLATLSKGFSGTIINQYRSSAAAPHDMSLSIGHHFIPIGPENSTGSVRRCFLHGSAGSMLTRPPRIAKAMASLGKLNGCSCSSQIRRAFVPPLSRRGERVLLSSAF
jgi:hypothetical protein